MNKKITDWKSDVNILEVVTLHRLNSESANGRRDDVPCE